MNNKKREDNYYPPLTAYSFPLLHGHLFEYHRQVSIHFKYHQIVIVSHEYKAICGIAGLIGVPLVVFSRTSATLEAGSDFIWISVVTSTQKFLA